MEPGHTFKEYKFEAGEYAQFQTLLKRQNFGVSNRALPGLLGTEAIIDRFVDDPLDYFSDRTCGAVIDYPWGVGNKGLLVIAGSRLEQLVQEYIVLKKAKKL